MKLSQTFFKTYKEDPQDAEIASHKLLVRAGFIKRQAAGSYIFLPIGLKVLQNISSIVRQEMNAAGACEVQMPMLLNEDVYERRIKSFGPSMFRLRDRNGKGMCLGPTHEEIFTGLIKDTVFSYKNLPINLYQIGTKFRDEVRPRFGLQRAREFIMKDAYSYDRDLAGLEQSYEKMKQAYVNIFNRLGLEFVIVDADNGAMGGFGSNEFMVKSDVGEDEIVVCSSCDYAANMEKATYAITKNVAPKTDATQKKLIYTPGLKTIDDVSGFLKLPKSQLLKAVAYSTDNELVFVYLRGDREVEEVKLINHLGTIKCELATAEEITNAGSVAGFVGPTDSFKKVRIIADSEVKTMTNFVMGGNKEDHHYTDCNASDIGGAEYVDIRKVVTGDPCPHCKGKLEVIRGIEVGHIFKLGTHYTNELNCTYLDEGGKEQLMYMGSYGVGVTRTLGALVEQNHDDHGIILPANIAPYQAGIFAANFKDEEQARSATKLYEALLAKGIDVLFDDRKETFGVKMKDVQLIGLPHAIVAGRAVADGKFEVVNRQTHQIQMLSQEEILQLF